MKAPWNKTKGINKKRIVLIFVDCQLKSIKYYTVFELKMPMWSLLDSSLKSPCAWWNPSPL
jgi:hypothetical protein